MWATHAASAWCGGLPECFFPGLGPVWMIAKRLRGRWRGGGGWDDPGVGSSVNASVRTVGPAALVLGGAGLGSRMGGGCGETRYDRSAAVRLGETRGKGGVGDWWRGLSAALCVGVETREWAEGVVGGRLHANFPPGIRISATGARAEVPCAHRPECGEGAIRGVWLDASGAGT